MTRSEPQTASALCYYLANHSCSRSKQTSISVAAPGVRVTIGGGDTAVNVGHIRWQAIKCAVWF